LEPLALAIWNRDPAVGNFDELVPTMVNPEKGLVTSDDVLNGVGQILAELVAETAPVRGVVRMVLWDTGRLSVCKSESLPEGKGLEYKDYFQFTEPARHIPPHRVLAINRGEKENALKVRLEFDADLVRRVTADHLPLAEHPYRDRLLPIVEDSLTRLVLPALEREIRRELTERAQDHAIAVFARNLRSLLLQRPLRKKRVIAIDPGFRTGCTVVALDESGQPLEHVTIHPHAPQKHVAEAKHKLEELIRKYQVDVLAIGNGTAGRDTEELVAGLIAEFDARRRGEVLPATAPHFQPATGASAGSLPLTLADAVPPPTLSFAFTSTDVPAQFPPPPGGEGLALAPVVAAEPPVAPKPPPLVLPSLDALAEPPADLAYVIVNEAGASDYATSQLGREEFPGSDAALRSAISIGRRLQDPLSELVKIDPHHVGVGLYQHDVHPKHLKESLAEVIESCVNHVGVDPNSAGVALLRHVSGLNQQLAREIVEYRNRNGRFTSREQLKLVSGLGESRWTQAVGFLKLTASDEPLDGTWIHPESYPVVRQLLGELGISPDVLRDASPQQSLFERANSVVPDEVAGRLHIHSATLQDMLDELARPGYDPRDDLPSPVFKRGVLKLEDLHAGMELKGTVLNVVPFGAFIDIGLKDSGLVHISQMANRYIKSPHEVVAVGDVVTVWVLAVDSERRRASLTMIPPGTERKPPERRPARGERGPAPGGPSPAPGPRPGQGQRQGPPHRGGRRPDRTSDQPGRPPSEQPASQPRPPRQLPERKPPKPRPLPNLTQAKKEGKEYLTTLGELAAFFKAREPHEAPEEPPAS
jgi:uncharacterized protein